MNNIDLDELESFDSDPDDVLTSDHHIMYAINHVV